MDGPVSAAEVAVGVAALNVSRFVRRDGRRSSRPLLFLKRRCVDAHLSDRREGRLFCVRATRHDGPSRPRAWQDVKPLSLLVPLFAPGWASPAFAAELPDAVSKSSYYVTLGLFIMTVPGLWSLIKRSTKSKIRQRTFAVPGPAEKDAMPLDDRAKQITRYFLNYNYQIKSMSDVIQFVGNFQSSVGQASQLVLYTFFGLGSIALVLSVQFPGIGNYWYLLTVISPLAGWYYWSRANREEEIKVKVVTSDDERVTDIIVEGDEEELDRFCKELNLQEKGKVYIKGIIEQ